MIEIELKLTNPKLGTGKGILVEQGIPVPPMKSSEVGSLRLLDSGGSPVPANIVADGRDENGYIVWVRLTTTVEIPSDSTQVFRLASEPSKPPSAPLFRISRSLQGISVETGHYRLTALQPGDILLESDKGEILSGSINFQLWPDARSIIGAGGGTCRLAHFMPSGWELEEDSPGRAILVLYGKVPKYAAYTDDPENYDPKAQFDCELELRLNAYSPIIRYVWRIENHTVWQAYLERYALCLPLALGSEVTEGPESDDGKYLDFAIAKTPGGPLALTASYVDALGAGAGINPERRQSLSNITLDEVRQAAGEGLFEPHRHFHLKKDDGEGIDLVSGGVNPPQDGTQWAYNPEVHRLFYRGMGRSFEGSLIVGGDASAAEAELAPIYFELPPSHYSNTGILPEAGDPVEFGEFRDVVMKSAEWMLRTQWRQSLWWGEWWREFDLFRGQGIESTANGNNPLGPLYHYFRTGDSRFIACARRSLGFQYDIQLSKQRDGIAPFFHSRRFLMDKLEWVHMRYQRIDGPIKAAHFFGDTRLRKKIIDKMRDYANALVCPNGAPGFAEDGPYGIRVPAGSDCTNFQEVLGICYRETGEPEFLKKARLMADWTLRSMKDWDWDASVGNSYGWHFLMRGMLSTIKLTGLKRLKDWYIDMARKNLTYPLDVIDYRNWMCWLLAEAQRMSGENWMLDEMLVRTREVLKSHEPEGVTNEECKQPWSKWPSVWQRLYDPKTVVAYVPVLTARRKAEGLD